MKLTEEQIQHLFAFTKNKYVKYYDLQVELVDHLATAIEAKLELYPELNFELALREVYKGFGIFGFSIIVEQKTEALKKFWRVKFMNFIKDYFKLPKIVTTIYLSFIIYKLFILSIASDIQEKKYPEYLLK